MRKGVRWIVLSFVAALGLLACIDDPEFHQVGEDVPATATDSTTPPPVGKDDDDATSYVPDGGVTGPGATACDGRVCAVGLVCCKNKCTPAKSKC